MPDAIAPLAAGEVRVYTINTGDRDVVRDALRCMLASLTGAASPGDIVFRVGDKGKPYLVNDGALFFSVSHSHEISILAITRVADVGVDVERVRAVPRAEEILRRFFAHEEISSILSDDRRDLRFTEAWTRAEATVKVRGASVWEAATPDPNVTVRGLRAPDGFVAAIAVGGGADTWHVTQCDLDVTQLVDTVQT